MESIMKHALGTAVAVGLASSASAASLTLANADFEASANDTLPASWTSSETVHTNGVYVWGSAGSPAPASNVLAYHGRTGRWVQQSFDTGEATADTYGQITVTFDSGWRSNTSAPNSLSLTFDILNVTDGGALASETYVFPPDSPSNLFNGYQVIQTGNTLVLSYDNTVASLVGDEIALRITSASSQDSFNPTGWIDNVSVTAEVPEPGSLALLGLGGLAMLRRRR